MSDFNLLDPISPDDPCGPDLERQDDAAFLDYYFEAEARMPERYFIPGNAGDGREDRLFDPRSVDLAAETATIRALLRRSRDLRLMGLLARFQILAGQLEAFAATVEDMAAALAQWPEALHPHGSERRAAVESLNGQPTVVMALAHLPVVSNTDVTLRRYMVATGKATPRASEQDLAGADLLAPLRAEANLRALTATHDRLLRLSDALHRLSRQAAALPEAPFRPDFGALTAALADMQAMIAAARPELRPWEPAAPAPEPPAGDLAQDLAAPAETARPQPATAPDRPVSDRATAEAALDAACAWLARHEPSSPALMLAAQARQLIGRPLVEALEMLMPQQAGAAVLRIGQGTPFALPMERLKALTQVGLEGQPEKTAPPAALPPITRRAEMIAALVGVEGYFATHEPASPVPLLLARARDMLSKRFDAIVAELLAPAPPSGES
ncbi:type VI secretion system protein ImpA [Paracoccus aminovorans]|uniref:Type VI secretion system protein ImpA n=1 Tax=Paracoccus aminovorans TaxID=34004 RepID=A0A1I3A9I2_9RHOB|nr:type VI secretion system ImpA family N-terminal domain-containing protein [Paracoccus aminovorans]CQR83837.1 type VI secretion system protein ImpA [Paracoccus aminovorans]SFH46570.1 type VI secretion system protein ImpA [Paracoccus aminovorans]